MKKENTKEFIKELKTLSEQYGYHNIVFGADDGNKEFFGCYNLNKNGKTLYQCGLNASRLYQSLRERIMGSLGE